MDTLALAKEITEEADATKAKDLVVLDLQKLVSYTDYFVIATGTSDRHVQAISDRVYRRLKDKLHRLPISYEGQDSGQWVLIDYGDVVFHVFQKEPRQFYGLDELWSDAPQVSLVASQKKAAKVKKILPAKKKPAKRKVKAKPKRAIKKRAVKKKKKGR
jgi:iojap-like ribosome-associated protein